MKTLKSKVHHHRKPRRVPSATGPTHEMSDLRDGDSFELEMQLLRLDRSPKQENL